ncbi:MAG: sigma-54-dependent Fis family transcriptional regulator [Myxococcota bacterium]
MGIRAPHNVDATVDTTRHAPGAASVDPKGARIVAVYPENVGFVADLGSDRFVLGRTPEEIGSPFLAHATVSRRHVEIEWDGALGAHFVTDLASRNGSWIDGIPLEEGWHRLSPGSVLRVGGMLFVAEAGHLYQEPDAAEVSREAIPGEALSARRLRREIARAAPDLSPALIIGETGTGKEQIAREIHRLSGRPGEFVAVNCATLGEQLIESQLFGHLKGSFTGATADQQGLFAAAEGGTLFLDEIGELPLELQPKLLRAIQEREIRRVGATKSEKVDARVVAATHRALGERVADGSFRQDLYARLSLWQVSAPAIRERRVDILSWIRRLHRLWAVERGLPEPSPVELHVEAAEALLTAPWAENLRGIHRFVHELARRTDKEALRKEALPAWVRR